MAADDAGWWQTVNVFYLDLQFNDSVDVTTIVLVADDKVAAKKEVREMVADPTSINSITVTNTFSLMHLPVVLETRTAAMHMGKFKFTGLLKGVDCGSTIESRS